MCYCVAIYGTMDLREAIGETMRNVPDNMQDIISNNITGFHEYSLTDPVHLKFVSQNLCDMTGYTEDELLSETEDLYLPLVHPADREAYSEFMQNLKSAEQTLTCEYRLVKKSGTFLYVNDTVTSKVLDDGELVAYSVLTDITDVKNENDNLRFLNETIPCGFIKYTCGKQPRITYINKQMMEFLRIPWSRDGELDYFELYKDNIFLMIPMEERRRFAGCLKRVHSDNVPVVGEMTLLRCDGTKAHVFGWIAKCINEQGIEEFQSVCMDVTERYQAKKENETKRYLKALTDVYDKIFEYNLTLNTVKCLYSNHSPMFQWMENVSMQMEDATEKWIAGSVVSNDCEKVRLFFRDFFQKKLYQSDSRPPQITYQSHSSSGEVKLYRGIFLKMDESVSLYCCRAVADMEEAEALRDENAFLKENMQELAMRFTDGMAAFAVEGEFVTPLYASDNVCGFFGFTKEEWMSLMEEHTPIKKFIERCNIRYEDFAKILESGEAEFSYFDLETETQRRIKAICSQKYSGGSLPRYIMLYNVDDAKSDAEKDLPQNPAVSIRTFGYFDVFVGEKAVAFRNKKAKELFALLVDRRGGYISSEEAISFLWEDEPVNPVTLSRYRKVALRLKNTLEEYGISDVMETVDGKRRVVTEKVQCDLYDYLTGKEEYAQIFKGSYLNNYSWGENTLAELTGDILY